MVTHLIHSCNVCFLRGGLAIPTLRSPFANPLNMPMGHAPVLDNRSSVGKTQAEARKEPAHYIRGDFPTSNRMSQESTPVTVHLASITLSAGLFSHTGPDQNEPETDRKPERDSSYLPQLPRAPYLSLLSFLFHMYFSGTCRKIKPLMCNSPGR